MRQSPKSRVLWLRQELRWDVEMGTFRMPSLGADMEAGTLVEWLVKPGDAVKRGDIIAVVETEKGAIEVEIFETGRIDELLVAVGTTVPVGTPLALVDGARAGAPAAAPIEKQEPAPAKVQPVAQAPLAVQAAPSGLRATPAARRLAKERGVDLASLKGSGPGGVIESRDVPPAAAGPRRGLDLDEMRKAIAAAMAKSKREIPHYYLQHTIDLSIAESWLDDFNAKRDPPERVLMAALFVKASSRAARKYTEFNGFYEAGTFKPSESVHAGVAIAIRGGGLVSPAIHDTDKLDLSELMIKMRDLVGRARVGRLRSSELSDATLTISSLGERGVDQLFGIIYPPQVALIGFGAPLKNPIAVDGEVKVRTVVTITLSGDHRVSDGHRGALLLREIGELLRHPETL
jgi:pyruvate dehydrogenase E2 component (dihydrolipoamide acetyltransferase)